MDVYNYVEECTCTHIHIIEDLPLISPPQVDCGPAQSCCYFSDTPNRGQTWGKQQRPVESAPSKERRKGNSQLPSCLRLPMLYCGKAATLIILWWMMKRAVDHPSCSLVSCQEGEQCGPLHNSECT